MIGCGNISNAYFKGLAPFREMAEIVACADMDLKRAEAKASEHGVAKFCSVKDLLADPAIEIVLNLTVPQAHAEINLLALKAGKHAYCEKPFSLNTREGLRVLKEAKARNLRVGCAPDTVLGGGIQSCRKLVEDAAIGTPIAAAINMAGHGHESWHPSPEFYYKPGGGPLFDMGPYYLTALLVMLGPASRVSASTKITFKKRTITSQPLLGQQIKVETPTHLTGTVEFENGAIATLTMSFDIWAHHLPMLEIYGTEGSLSCPDPNNFDGEVKLWQKETKWTTVPLSHNDQTRRGIGLADMAQAIRQKRPHRMSGEMALHVVEIMEAFLKAGETGKSIKLKSSFKKPKPLAPGLALGELK